MTVTEQSERHEEVQGSSDRAFGFVFAVVFITIALWPVVTAGGKPRGWAMGLGVLFMAAGLLYPEILAPLNRLWTRFGLLLHRIVSPLVMGILFFLVVTPIALLMRVFGQRPLSLGFDRRRASYWIVREPPGPPPDTMKQQF